MTSRTQMILTILKSQPNTPFTARELAQQIFMQYAEELQEKRSNPKFESDEDFIIQLAAEIGGSATKTIQRNYPQVQTRDQPRPRLYYWSETENLDLSEPDIESEPSAASYSEHELYPLLIAYLFEEQGLYCRRIDEKRSRNDKGNGGNHWLYPDIVALETQGIHWQPVVKSCLQNHLSRLWSFEVKRKLNRSNVRQAFFQAVSNSSWAHYGYLVTAEINEDRHNGVLKELQMLSALHGIGVMVLDTHDLAESKVLLPARDRLQVDWDSVNRLVEENRDMEDFIELVSMYHQTGKVRKVEWNK